MIYVSNILIFNPVKETALKMRKGGMDGGREGEVALPRPVEIQNLTLKIIFSHPYSLTFIFYLFYVEVFGQNNRVFLEDDWRSNNNNNDNLFSIYEFLHKKYTQQQLFIIYIIST